MPPSWKWLLRALLYALGIQNKNFNEELDSCTHHESKFFFKLFLKLSVCTYSECFIISKCTTCTSIFPTKMMKVTRKNTLLF
jgi:hypothetical protein